MGLAASFWIGRFGSTNMESMFGLVLAPVGATLLLLLWWLFGSRVPWRDRIIGLVIFLVLLVATALGKTAYGAIVSIMAAPYLSYGAVIVLVLFRRRSWPVQRRMAIGYLLVCTVLFAALRVDSVGGDMSPVASWRWEVSVDETPLESLSVVSPGKAADLPSTLSSSDWPAFRGANQDSRVPGVTFDTGWDTSPKELWRKQVGLGWSSFTVIGDYFFTQEQRGEEELVICYRVDTAEEVWINATQARFEDFMGSGPRATPTYHDGALYTQGATGIIQRIDARTGETIWKRDLKADTGAEIPIWGFSGSPLVAAEKVITFCGGTGAAAVMAYDRATGEPAWNVGSGTHSYVTGQLAHIAGTPQVLILSDYGIQSLSLETGSVLWEQHLPLESPPRVAQPQVVDGNAVLFASPTGHGTRRLAIESTDDAWTVTEEWVTKKFRPYFNDYVIHEGHCYGYDGNRMMCIDVSTGERQWRGDRLGGQLILLSDMDALLVLTEEGEVILVDAKPDAYEIITRFQAITGKTWNHPVIAQGKLFLRNAQEAVCYDLAIK
jgi:outer membrane protein assembly factor BamB